MSTVSSNPNQSSDGDIDPSAPTMTAQSRAQTAEMTKSQTAFSTLSDEGQLFMRGRYIAGEKIEDVYKSVETAHNLHRVSDLPVRSDISSIRNCLYAADLRKKAAQEGRAPEYMQEKETVLHEILWEVPRMTCWLSEME